MDAQSLLEPGSSGMPRLHDGRMEVQKPPLFYWLVALIARCRGGEVDALAVRLPAALSAAATVLLVGLGVGLGYGRPTAGLLAGTILATGIHFPWLARIGRIDMPLTFTVTLAGGAFILALQRVRETRRRDPSQRPAAETRRQGDKETRRQKQTVRETSPLANGSNGVHDPSPCLLVSLSPCLTQSPSLLVLGAYLACAAAVLLKGPVGLALPGAIVAAVLIAQGRWPAFWELRRWRALLGELGLWWGLPLVLLLVIPVFVWAEYASGGQLAREFFWHHNVQRALGGSQLRSHPWFWYGPYFLLYFLPYSPLVLLALPSRLWREDWLARSGLAWTVGVILLLSCASFKRADYLLPAYPGAAVFLGCVLEHCLNSARRFLVLSGVVAVAALMAIGWGVRLMWLMPAEEPYRDYRPFAAVVRRHAPTPSPVLFFRTEAHALAFRVGQPLRVLLEWSELQAHVQQPGPHYLVMPPDCAAQCPRLLHGVRLREVCRNTSLAGGKHERPLVLVQVKSK
jgi:4-amino-4-deoxy-L-arabinose transferase-like glycosyltransferase